MPNIRRQLFKQKILTALAQRFFQGVIVLAPIGVTIWVVVSLFNWVDNFLPNLLNLAFPQQFAEVNGQIPKVTGLGFVVAIALVLVVGWLSSLFFVERLMSIFDKILERTPGIKIIYSSVKDFLEAFAGNKKKFDEPVLVNVDSTDVWRIGFITQKNTANILEWTRLCHSICSTFLRDIWNYFYCSFFKNKKITERRERRRSNEVRSFRRCYYC